MTTFYTDADRVGAGEFVEGEVSLATEFTVPDGVITRFRWPFPTVAPGVTPMIRLYDASNAVVGGAAIAFDTSTLDAWNWATPVAPLTVAAGTYRATVNTTRYPAQSGFFAGGPVVRGDITGVQGRFASGVAAPGSTSTAGYLVDIDFTADTDPAEGTAALGLNLAVAAAGARASRGAAAVGLNLAVAAVGARASRGAATVGLNLAVAAAGTRPARGAAALGLNLAVAAAGTRPARGAVALGLNLAVAAVGSNGSIGRPVSHYPWTPRPVRSFSEVPEP